MFLGACGAALVLSGPLTGGRLALADADGTGGGAVAVTSAEAVGGGAVAATVTTLDGTRLASHRRTLFDEIRALAYERAGLPRPAAAPAGDGGAVPYLNEPWYCCAEPTDQQLQSF